VKALREKRKEGGDLYPEDTEKGGPKSRGIFLPRALMPQREKGRFTRSRGQPWEEVGLEGGR